MENKKLCAKCKKYYHPVKFKMCWKCYSEAPARITQYAKDEAGSITFIEARN